ncbi:hypothetical protein SS50377_27792 [Spironucleus salmonicida]|uniref:Secreted protein n=1 Tax=Spironucleus salmonicida TaxID=348837 RepID=V6LRR5_9EUKA|nr:hypothetical protein SS50377_27783 [Spironucleus salmonicida]KAH0569822.1 hypothetical protein SS50377_27792 [Spironucleus salmonicida]|eukprot:EST46953.1 Hypothetical protein SS50377_13012 [Spironucleus salmonicida]
MRCLCRFLFVWNLVTVQYAETLGFCGYLKSAVTRGMVSGMRCFWHYRLVYGVWEVVYMQSCTAFQRQAELLRSLNEWNKIIYNCS